MKNKEFNLIEFKENTAVLSNEVEFLLDEYKESKKVFEEAEKKFRNELLKTMIKYNIVSAKIGKYTISQVIPKPTLRLKEDEFTTENDLTTLQLFVKIDTIENFNMEKFIKEQPEMYSKYLVKEEKLTFDIKKIQKLRPDLAEKYIEEIQSDKEITLRIANSEK